MFERYDHQARQLVLLTDALARPDDMYPQHLIQASLRTPGSLSEIMAGFGIEIADIPPQEKTRSHRPRMFTPELQDCFVLAAAAADVADSRRIRTSHLLIGALTYCVDDPLFQDIDMTVLIRAVTDLGEPERASENSTL